MIVKLGQSLFRHIGSAVGFLYRISTTDYCPQWNKVFRLLYRPVGWLPVAGTFAILLAIFVNATLWSIAAGIFGLWIFGLAWPVLGLAGLRASWSGLSEQVQEGEPVRVRLTISNAWPLPIYGLTISSENKESDEEPTASSMSLSRVGALSRSQYNLQCHERIIGPVPSAAPKLECGFPMDVYQGRKTVTVEQSTLVVPWSTTMQPFEIKSIRSQHAGIGLHGSQPGQDGDLTGLRSWQSGESWRNMHWAQSARQGKWIVKQRTMLSKPRLRLTIIGAPTSERDLSDLSVRILKRWLASCGRTLLHQGYQVELWVEGEWQVFANPQTDLPKLFECVARQPIGSFIQPRVEAFRSIEARQWLGFAIPGFNPNGTDSIHQLSGTHELPQKWFDMGSGNFMELIDELNWCQANFPEFWQRCFRGGLHDASA